MRTRFNNKTHFLISEIGVIVNSFSILNLLKKQGQKRQKEIDNLFKKNLAKISWKLDKEFSKNDNINENIFICPTAQHTER